MQPDDTNTTSEEDELKARRLARMSPEEQTRTLNKNYSRAIKRIQIILPIIALVFITIIFNWNRFQTETISPLKEEAEAIAEQSIGKNEFIEPKFESVDDKGQPFTIIAKNASQEENEEDLLILDEPNGQLKTNESAIITIQSQNGEYRQAAEKLFLYGNVILKHNEEDTIDGYQMNMEELHLDLATNTAHSNVDVSGFGPEGTIQAKGVKAVSKNNTLIFTGPAKLVLTLEEGGLNLGNISP